MTYHSRKIKKHRLILFICAAGTLLIGVILLFLFRQNSLFALKETTEDPVKTPATALEAPRSTPAEPKKKGPERSLYEIAAKLSKDGSTLSCIERITYVNTSNDTLYEIVLNTYANAFLSEKAVSEKEFKNVYGKEFSIGGIEIERMSLNGFPCFYKYKNPDKTQLGVPLFLELEPGDRAEIILEFKLTIPKANNRFGAGKNATMLGNVFPIAAVYENGWRLDDYIPIGDPFFSETSDYKLAVQLPKEYMLLSTGSIVSTSASDETVTYYIAAPGVREAALAFAADYAFVSRQSGTVTVNSSAKTESRALFAAEAACEALSVFSGLIGPYPYESLSVVQSDIGGGMEYPGLIMIGEECYGKYNKEFGEFCIAHETAHQWWYAAVGSDQINTPWVDEALAEYMGFVYWREKYGEKEFERLWARYIGPKPDHLNHPIDAPLFEFSSVSDYAESVYRQGARMLRALNEKIGDKVFFMALKKYYERNFGKTASERDLAGAFMEASGEDLTGFFADWGIDLND
ncbi:MAG: Aminopeptidase N [Firmicutes bacterium ADurb.Bin182]|nr:MAG: Aminopeptidase N [Firmicutes bacterium ADurb.Bin182]